MGVRSVVRDLVYGPPVMRTWSPEFVQKQLSLPPETLITALQRLTATNRQGVWRRVSVREALGVPAIHRAVSLISSTTGMLSVSAYRNGTYMDDPPRLVTRPDPYETPGAFYGGTAADKATYGEFVWWIATLDDDGLASSLIRVPLTELTVTENPDNRLRPKYTWGTITGTRFSGANPTGRFVHVKDVLTVPFGLRGEGPLQRCGVANSVAVESQNWAGNFYGEGGHPSTVIKKAGILSPELLDPITMLPSVDGKSEADILRDQVIGRSNNTAMVIDDLIESIEFKQPNTVGAQMLDARDFNNGDAAREFAIPGPLLEYSAPGSSLTYQNRAELKGHLLEMCLMPLYLEPIEQALSDLLTRSTVARFNVKGFLRADIKTRYDVHAIAITSGIYDPAYAQREEGILPGDVEFAPVPFAAPASIPAPLPKKTASLRDARCPSCNKLVAKTLGAGSEVECPRCKTLVRGPEAEETRSEPTSVVNFHERAIHVELQAPPPAQMMIADGAIRIQNVQPAVHVEPSPVTIEKGAIELNLKQAAMPADFEAAESIVTQLRENAEAIRAVETRLNTPKVVDKQVLRDEDGRLIGVRETELIA